MNTKKIAALLMALLLAVTMLLSGCGDKGDNKKDDTDKKTETTAAATEKVTEAVKDKVDADDKEEGLIGYDVGQIAGEVSLFCETGDVDKLRDFVLPKSAEILEYMRAQEIVADLGYSIVENYGYHDFSDVIEVLDEIEETDCGMLTDISMSAVDPETGEEVIYDNQMDWANDWFVANTDHDLYSLAEEAFNEAYKDSAENLEYKSLSLVQMHVDFGTYTPITHTIFVVETNVGSFLLCEIA